MPLILKPWYIAVFAAGYAATLTPAAADYAIAFGKANGRWAFGSSSNAPSLEQAKQQALEGCGLKGCKIVMSGRGQCVALTISRETSNATWISAETLAKAREDALIECSATGRKCTIQTSFCDGQTSSPPPAQPAPVLVRPVPPPAPPLAAPTSTPKRAPETLPISQITAFRERVSKCWSVSKDDGEKGLTAYINIRLAEDGSLSSTPTIAEFSKADGGYNFALKSVAAVKNCAPYPMFIGSNYNLWKDMELRFDTRSFTTPK